VDVIETCVRLYAAVTLGRGSTSGEDAIPGDEG